MCIMDIWLFDRIHEVDHAEVGVETVANTHKENSYPEERCEAPTIVSASHLSMDNSFSIYPVNLYMSTPCKMSDATVTLGS